jgi:hypothetical protein
MAAAGHGIVLNARDSDSTREPGRRGELSDGTYGARASSPSREVPVRCSRESRASRHGAAEPLSMNQPVDAFFCDALALSTGPLDLSAPHHSVIQCSNRAFNTCHGLLDGPCSVSAFWHFLIGHPDPAARVSPPLHPPGRIHILHLHPFPSTKCLPLDHHFPASRQKRSVNQ